MNLLRKSIILADDDEDDREMFEDAFMQLEADIELMQAADGKQLMDLLDGTVPPPPDVIFLDLNMPIMNGFECLNEIRTTQKFKKIPVVIYSTSCEKEFIDKVYDQGADFYICKPTSFSLIKNAISRALAIDWQAYTERPAREQFVLA